MANTLTWPVRRPWLVRATFALSLYAAVPALAGFEFELQGIHRANPDGSQVEVLLPSHVAQSGWRLALDHQFLFWMGGEVPDYTNLQFLRRASVEGENMQDLLGPAYIGGIAIDSIHSKLYFTPQSDCAPDCSWIARTNLDGSNAEALFPTGFPGAIALYAATGRVCWSDLFIGDRFESGIACADAGDAEGQIVVSETAEALAIDPVHQKLYWTRPDRIRRANLDGSNIQDLVLGLDGAYGIALDPSGNRMWWTEMNAGKIRRSDLDGSNVQDVVTELNTPSAIGFIGTPGGTLGKIYWLSVTPEQVPATSAAGTVVLALLLLATSSALLSCRRPRQAPGQRWQSGQ